MNISFIWSSTRYLLPLILHTVSVQETWQYKGLWTRPPLSLTPPPPPPPPLPHSPPSRRPSSLGHTPGFPPEWDYVNPCTPSWAPGASGRGKDQGSPAAGSLRSSHKLGGHLHGRAPCSYECVMVIVTVVMVTPSMVCCVDLSRWSGQNQ